MIISLNIAGGIGDLVTACWLLRKPKELLILDHGDDVRNFQAGIRQ